MENEVFSYRVSKDSKVFISWYGKLVTILGIKESQKFLSRIKDADDSEAQLLMARVTGNFKRGNEKDNKNKN